MAVLPKASTPLVQSNGVMTPEWYRLFQSAFGEVNTLTDLSGAATTAETMPGNATTGDAPDTRLTPTQIKALLAIGQGDVSGLTAALGGKADTGQTWEQSWLFLAPENGDYRMVVSAKVARTITSVTTRSATGTITLTVKIGTTALGGSTSPISTAEVTRAHSTANVLDVGADILFTFSSNSSCEEATVTLGGTLTLA